MARLYTYIIITIGLSMLLSLAGINTATGFVLSSLNPFNIENLKSTSFYVTVLAVLTGVVAGGIIIGYLTKSSPESYLLVPVAIALFAFIGDIIAVITYAYGNYPSWVGHLTALIFSPLAIGYILSIIEWWRGTA